MCWQLFFSDQLHDVDITWSLYPHVNFRSPRSSTECVQATMGDMVKLSCPDGRTVQNITFASYGDPGGHCGSYVQGKCHSSLVGEYLQKECYRKPYCNVLLKEEQFGVKCDEQVFFKTLRLQFTCSGWWHSVLMYFLKNSNILQSCRFTNNIITFMWCCQFTNPSRRWSKMRLHL